MGAHYRPVRGLLATLIVGVLLASTVSVGAYNGNTAGSPETYRCTQINTTPGNLGRGRSYTTCADGQSNRTPPPPPVTGPSLSVSGVTILPPSNSRYCVSGGFPSLVFFLGTARITGAAPNTPYTISISGGATYQLSGTPTFAVVTTDANGAATFTGPPVTTPADPAGFYPAGIADFPPSEPTIPTALTIAIQTPRLLLPFSSANIVAQTTTTNVTILPCTMVPTLTVMPASGNRGAQFAVSGTNFGAANGVTLAVTDPTGAMVFTQGNIAANASGAFQTTIDSTFFRVSGTYTATAAGNAAFVGKPTSTFTVNVPTPLPGSIMFTPASTNGGPVVFSAVGLPANTRFTVRLGGVSGTLLTFTTDATGAYVSGPFTLTGFAKGTYTAQAVLTTGDVEQVVATTTLTLT